MAPGAVAETSDRNRDREPIWHRTCPDTKRELALQVAEALRTSARDMVQVLVLPVYGVQPMHKQIERRRGGVHVIIGTSGHIMDHLGRGALNFAALKMVVLDEADERYRGKAHE